MQGPVVRDIITSGKSKPLVHINKQGDEDVISIFCPEKIMLEDL